MMAKRRKGKRHDHYICGLAPEQTGYSGRWSADLCGFNAFEIGTAIRIPFLFINCSLLSSWSHIFEFRTAT